MELADLPLGHRARVVRVDSVLGDGICLRLRELGLRDGVALEVTHCAAFGGKVIGIGADRFALDARTCALITICPFPPDDVVARARFSLIPASKRAGRAERISA